MISHIYLGSGNGDNAVGAILGLFCGHGKSKISVNQSIVLITKKRNLINIFKPLGLLFAGQAKLCHKLLTVYPSSLFINGNGLYIVLSADILGIFLATFC